MRARRDRPLSSLPAAPAGRPRPMLLEVPNERRDSHERTAATGLLDAWR
jgi:hypothetical protein